MTVFDCDCPYCREKRETAKSDLIVLFGILAVIFVLSIIFLR